MPDLQTNFAVAIIGMTIVCIVLIGVPLGLMLGKAFRLKRKSAAWRFCGLNQILPIVTIFISTIVTTSLVQIICIANVTRSYFNNPYTVTLWTPRSHIHFVQLVSIINKLTLKSLGMNFRIWLIINSQGLFLHADLNLEEKFRERNSIRSKCWFAAKDFIFCST
jgi:hypothetical protein